MDFLQPSARPFLLALLTAVSGLISGLLPETRGKAERALKRALLCLTVIGLVVTIVAQVDAQRDEREHQLSILNNLESGIVDVRSRLVNDAPAITQQSLEHQLWFIEQSYITHKHRFTDPNARILRDSIDARLRACRLIARLAYFSPELRMSDVQTLRTLEKEVRGVSDSTGVTWQMDMRSKLAYIYWAKLQGADARRLYEEVILLGDELRGDVADRILVLTAVNALLKLSYEDRDTTLSKTLNERHARMQAITDSTFFAEYAAFRNKEAGGEEELAVLEGQWLELMRSQIHAVKADTLVATVQVLDSLLRSILQLHEDYLASKRSVTPHDLGDVPRVSIPVAVELGKLEMTTGSLYSELEQHDSSLAWFSDADTVLSWLAERNLINRKHQVYALAKAASQYVYLGNYLKADSMLDIAVPWIDSNEIGSYFQEDIRGVRGFCYSKWVTEDPRSITPEIREKIGRFLPVIREYPGSRAFAKCYSTLTAFLRS